MKAPNYWLVIANSEDRTYHGHSGYEDHPHRSYQYDNMVNNSLRVADGDVLVIFGVDHVIGAAIVESIDSEAGEKGIRRCPHCPNTNLHTRKTKAPRYRCDNGHEFDEPGIDIRRVTKFTARYDGTFMPASRSVGRERVRKCELAPKSQGGIRPLHPEHIPALLSDAGISLPIRR